MRLMIAIPAMDFVPVEFAESLGKLTARLTRDGIDFELTFEKGTLVYMARDRLAGKAVNHGFTHVLWLDSDMVFTDGILDDLRFCGKDFVTGIAHSRRKPYSSCLFKDLALTNLTRWTVDEYPSAAFEVAGCGFACVLIRTEIIKAVMEKFNTAFTPYPMYGEDLSFCKRAVSMGYKIYAEPSVSLGHVGHQTVWPEDEVRT